MPSEMPSEWRVGHLGEVGGRVAQELKGRVGTLNGGGLVLGRDCQRRVDGLAHDLLELVGGDQGVALVLHLYTRGGNADRDLGVGGGERERIVLS